jgi:hypothetical protein
MAENREDDGKICTVQYGILYGSGCKAAAPYNFLQRNCSVLYQGKDGKDADQKTPAGRVGVPWQRPRDSTRFWDLDSVGRGSWFADESG